MLIYKEEELSRLIDQFAGGNLKVFEKIAALIHQDILNIAYRYVGNSEDAKDVLQEVLLKIYRKGELFKKGAKFSTWVYRITINASLDFLRKRKRVFNLFSRYKKNRKEDVALADKIDLRDKKQRLSGAVYDLPLRQKNVFILKHYQGLTIQKISASLACSQSTVKTHLQRAINTLTQKIGGLQ